MRRLIACVVMLACGLRAQEAPKPAAPLATAAPLVRIDALGPAAWRAQFLPTNLGSLLASAEGGKLLGPLIAHMDALWTRLADDAQGTARARWLGFGGAVTVGVWTDGAMRAPRVHGVVAIAAPPADAKLLAEDLARCMQRLQKGGERELAGQKFTVMHTNEMACTLPVTLGDRLVVLVADRESDLAKAAEFGLPWLTQGIATPPNSAPLRIRVDLTQAVALAGAGDGRQFDALGVSSLAEFVASLSADGPHVKAEFEVGFNARERGLFAGFFPERAGVPSLGDLLPKNATGWKVGRFDPLALWRAGLRATAALGRDTEAELLAEAKRECGGIDPGADLFAHLGDELLALWQDDSSGTAPPSGHNLSLCLVMSITDDKKVAESVGKMLAESDLEIRTDDGVMRVVQPNNWLFPAIHVAVGRGVACLAFGGGGEAQVDSVLACAKVRKPAPPAGADLFSRRAPAGFNSVGSLGLATLLRYHLEFLFDSLDELIHVVPIEGRVVSRELEAWWPLLEKHDLLRVSTLTGCAGGRWRLRVLW